MIYGIHHSAAGMMTHEYRRGVLANNLANADTTGFKRDVAVFTQRLRADEAGLRSGPSDPLLDLLAGGTWMGQTETDFSNGTLVDTGNEQDVALAGPGFFRVRAGGQEYLTRDGRFQISRDGRLVSALDGAELLSIGGGPVLVNRNGGPLAIDEEGTIRQGGGVVGRLGVVDVADPRGLQKAGHGRFVADGAVLMQAPAQVIQGHLESSGVEPIQELTALLETSRAFQLNAQMLTLQDQTRARLINLLSAA